MRYLIAAIGLLFSTACFANSYYNCKVDNLFTHEHMPNLVTVTLNCVAPDAATGGANCVAGTVKNNAFIFDTSSATGKNHMALAITAMSAGNNIHATTFAACPASATDTLWLYALRVFKP